jgi:hypothetical protein
MKTRALYLFTFLVVVCSGCKKRVDTLFRLLPADRTGISFNNIIQESDTFNILTHEYIYNGGGVGLGDFNNDGLQDIFFAGNLVPNKLYLNKGGLEFTDITDIAAVNVPGRWNSGVAIVDINNDGWDDIYVTATMKPDSADRRNMMFINKGLDSNGIPTFEDQAQAYGIDDTGYSVTAAFFDYDLDGDLDLYVLTNQRLDNFPTNYRPKMVKGESPNNDKLFRNNGNGTFTNVTKESGITIEGFGLGLCIADLNKDSWPDIYVSNDYLSNDILYINKKNGTFENKISEYIGHQSQFSMGNDAADINNDGEPELITLDMLPETHYRKKTTISNKSYLNYINNEKYQYEYQYVRNMLHFNNGLDHNIKFSEIGQFAGVYQTEWSWSPLFADFDNDGNKDLIITNGFPKDVTDKDFSNYRGDVGNIARPGLLIDSIPTIKIPNYGFKNNGNLTFTDVTQRWGLQQPSFSNGAAYGDLDNDGDVDYVVNNINDPAFIYENQLNNADQGNKYSAHNYLRVKLKGNANNPHGLGAKISVFEGGKKMQYYEMEIYRGFLSSIEPIAHFGLGKAERVDSIVIQWPDARYQLLKDIKSNQLLEVKYAPNYQPTSHASKQTFLHEVTGAEKIVYKHNEEDKIDFNLQRTLPHKFSQAGPSVAVADINNDGLEDFLVGGSTSSRTSVFIQQAFGNFKLEDARLTADGKKPYEDEGLLLFDADSDGDQDLYIVTGSVESNDSTNYRDHFFLNNGRGIFTADDSAIPNISASGSCVRAADYDKDGDLDLFVGGRVIPGQYPLPGKNFILKNNNGRFEDVTGRINTDLNRIGMVTDAIWTDFDNDGNVDLLVVGEFMAPTFFRNGGDGTFTKLNDTGVQNNYGWWNSISAADFDRDGDIDFVVGNLGTNNNYQVTDQYPLKLYALDIDGNGSMDPILACYMRETMLSPTKDLYAVHFWDELNSQSPKFRRKFSRFSQFGKAKLENLLTEEEQRKCLVLQMNYPHSAYIQNNGNGKFKMSALPAMAQVAPVNGLVADDVNYDGNCDVLLVGNDYGNEIFSGRYDAFTGLVLLGDGKGNFLSSPSKASGFYVKGDAKALTKLTSPKGDMYIATQNRDSLKIFTPTNHENNFIFTPKSLDAKASITFNDGSMETIEFYYGSGYLSQSTRAIRVPKNIREFVVYDSKGKKRSIQP